MKRPPQQGRGRKQRETKLPSLSPPCCSKAWVFLAILKTLGKRKARPRSYLLDPRVDSAVEGARFDVFRHQPTFVEKVESQALPGGPQVAVGRHFHLWKTGAKGRSRGPWKRAGLAQGSQAPLEERPRAALPPRHRPCQTKRQPLSKQQHSCYSSAAHSLDGGLFPASPPPSGMAGALHTGSGITPSPPTRHPPPLVVAGGRLMAPGAPASSVP